MAATAALASDGKPEPSLPITMTHVPPDACTMTVSGQTFALPKNDAAALAALQYLRRTWAIASIGSAADIPYRCTAAVLLIVQQAGFDRIGFVGLPTPKPSPRRPSKSERLRPR
ncbi:hypothetical protein [uncultured Sphingomonas sp.]|uniref:hypothetical protein n=1 Tax=uncultured Sphingomonas sp. TaxID=158754 RepID=UPI0025D61C50|nr:hypothetical protein [uncultured Sphingomonas sp.]